MALDERHRADAVFEGGGVKGIAFAGAIAAAEKDAGVEEWVNVAGTSRAGPTGGSRRCAPPGWCPSGRGTPTGASTLARARAHGIEEKVLIMNEGTPVVL